MKVQKTDFKGFQDYTNPITERKGVRVHGAFTAALLKILAKIKLVSGIIEYKDENAHKTYFFNKGSFKKLCEMNNITYNDGDVVADKINSIYSKIQGHKKINYIEIPENATHQEIRKKTNKLVVILDFLDAPDRPLETTAELSWELLKIYQRTDIHGDKKTSIDLILNRLKNLALKMVKTEECFDAGLLLLRKLHAENSDSTRTERKGTLTQIEILNVFDNLLKSSQYPRAGIIGKLFIETNPQTKNEKLIIENTTKSKRRMLIDKAFAEQIKLDLEKEINKDLPNDQKGLDLMKQYADPEAVHDSEKFFDDNCTITSLIAKRDRLIENSRKKFNYIHSNKIRASLDDEICRIANSDIIRPTND